VARRAADLLNCSAESVLREPEIDAHVIALKPRHPYLRLPLQFSAALEPRLLETLSDDELASLRGEAETELAEPGRWGTTFTLIQSKGRLEGWEVAAPASWPAPSLAPFGWEEPARKLVE
jgi:hypothetical protein